MSPLHGSIEKAFALDGAWIKNVLSGILWSLSPTCNIDECRTNQRVHRDLAAIIVLGSRDRDQAHQHVDVPPPKCHLLAVAKARVDTHQKVVAERRRKCIANGELFV